MKIPSTQTIITIAVVSLLTYVVVRAIRLQFSGKIPDSVEKYLP